MVCNTLSEVVYPVTGKEIPNLIPGVDIGFRVCGSVTLAYVWINKKLRIGVANCSMKDKYNQVAGERKALKLAFAQHDMSHSLRQTMWYQYLISRGMQGWHTLSQLNVQRGQAEVRQIR